MIDDVLEGLNEEQVEAVVNTEGYIRVIAGAGAGKTRALTHRFAYLVNELGIRPGNILCVTFTNKAAAEMRHRIHQMIDDHDTGYVCTFHSFCVSILQEDSHAIAFSKSFLVLDNSDIDAMLKMIYEERGLTLRDMTFAKARDMFEIRKGVTEPMYYLNLVQMSLEDLRQKYMDATKVDDILFYGYLYQQKKCFGLDYNDLIFLSLYIFREYPQIQLKWQKRLEYIMIDEFQDIDPPQYDLMKALCGYHNNLFIVGDPDQTIYTWRGARIGYLLNFDKRFENVKTIMMMKNYRSTPEILNVANALIDVNEERMKKDLLPTLDAGRKPVYYHGKSPTDEAIWMAKEIQQLVQTGVGYRDIALLYRAHYVTRAIEEVFLQMEIPYQIYSGVSFFERMEIKDALSYLRFIAYQDDLSFVRIINVPKRNIGQKRMQFLQDIVEKEGISYYQALQNHVEDDIFRNTGAAAFIDMIEGFRSRLNGKQVSEVLTDVLDQSGYEEMLRTEGSQNRLDDLAELKQSIYEWETNVGEETDLVSYLQHISLFSNLDLIGGKNCVKLMTVHSAKGLQFPYVFLCAMNEGIFPSRKVKTKSGMEEERRLAFVAMTRAEKELYLSDSEGRNIDDTSRFPSRFIMDIPSDLLTWLEEPDERWLTKVRKHITILNEHLLPDQDNIGFQQGDRVRHRVFGMGTVQNIDFKEEAIYILFDHMPTPRAIALRAAAKLEKIQMS